MIFGISGTELAVILFIGLLVVGPNKLPEYARKAGELVRTIREQWSGLRKEGSRQIDQTMQDAGLADIKHDLDEIAGRPHTA